MGSLSIGKAWDEAKVALQANRKLIVPVAFGLILLPAVIVSMVEPRVDPGVQPPPGAWMLVAFAMLIVMIVGQLSIVLMINGWKGSVGEAIAKAGRRTPTFILAALAYLLPVILIFSLLLGLSGMGAGDQFDWTSLGTMGWLLLFLFFLTLIFVSIRMLPLIAVVGCEGMGAIASLKRSFSLTSGHFWRLFAFLLMLMIGFLVVAMTVGSVVGGIVTIAFGVPEPWSLSLLLIALAGGLVQAGFVMVYAGMLARIYVQLSAGQPGVPDVSRES